MPPIGPRLLAAARLLGHCESFVDVGANHGFLSAYMVREGLCRRALVCDISDKALDKARETIQKLHLEQQTKTIVTDGLSGIALQPTDGVAILGMGARTIVSILEQCTSLPCPLVLQANVELPLLRRYLAQSGLHIEKECVVKDEGRFYVLQRVSSGNVEAYSPWELQTGKLERYEPSPLLLPFFRWRLGVAKASLDGAALGSDEKKRQRAREEYEAMENMIKELEK